MGKVPIEIITAAKVSHAAYPTVFASVTIAQWALESAWGQHMPAGSNNPFGIKAKPGQEAVEALTWEHIGGRDVKVVQRFRRFRSLTDAFMAHATLLGTSGYYAHARAAKSANAQAHALQGVYATDPNYASKLIKLMDDYSLRQFDAPARKPAPQVAEVKPVTQTKVDAPMNPIAIFTLAIGLARDVAPMIPEIVGDVKMFVADVEKLIADLSKKDINTTMADIEKLFDDVKTDIPTVLKAVKVAKTLPLS